VAGAEPEASDTRCLGAELHQRRGDGVCHIWLLRCPLGG
jgi:hypothetical protein